MNTAVRDLNRKCGKEAKKVPNLCVNVIFSKVTPLNIAEVIYPEVKILLGSL